MGGTVERFLQRTGGPDATPLQPTRTSTAVDRFLTDSDTTAQLGLSVERGMQTNGDRAARVLRLETKTGLPQDLIERNLESIEAEARRADFDPAAFRRSNPIVARWLAENPNHPAIASEDLSKLSYLERQFRNIKDRFVEGRATTELQSIGESAMLGSVTAEQRRRQAELERSTQTSEDYGITGFFEGIPGAIANQLPIFVQTLGAKAKAAALGASVAGGSAAAGAAIFGQLGPQVALPEEVITVPAAAAVGVKTGGALGWRWGAGVQAARMEGALAYLEFEKIRDANGNPLDRNTMLGAAMITGVVNGALEMVGFESMLKAVPGLRALGKSEMKRALASQTVRQAVAHYGKSIAEAMVTEGTTEFLQDVVKNAAGELSTMVHEGSTLSPGAIIDRVFSDEHMREAIADAKAGAQAGAGMAASSGAVSLQNDVRRAQDAARNAQAFQAIGQGVTDSKLMERLPAKMQEVVERLTQDGPAEHVYAPVETWNEYFQSKQLDPAAVAEEVLGNRDAYDEAMRTGGDLAIPTARYVTQLAATEHNAFFVNELRASPVAMNLREAQSLVKELDAIDQKQTEEAAPTEAPAATVGATITEQLQAAGFDEKTAGTYAQVYESAFRTLGQRAGVDPLALFQRFGLNIERPDIAQQQEPVDVAGMAERRAVEGERTPYELPAEERDLAARTTGNEFVYARAPGGTLRTNLKRVSVAGLVDEYTRLLEANNTDVGATAGTLVQDENFHSTSDARPVVVGNEGTKRAAGRIEQRQKSIAKIEREFKRRGVDDIPALMAEQQLHSEATSFEFGQAERGRIKIGDQSINIELLKDADLSTFLHETGHFYLEVLGDLATGENPTPEISADYSTVLTWLGVENRTQITREEHEQFARGFEAYLMEGKAPTSALRDAFARFRAWLVGIYRSMKSLNVELTPEVRRVFDRLLASEDEIRAAEQEQSMQPLFPDPEAVGMTAADAERYTAAIADARRSAEEELSAKLVADVRREQTAVWQAEREKVRAEVVADVNQDPQYLALSVLSRGTLPDGTALPETIEKVKLSREGLVDMFGEEILKKLPRPYVYAREGGIHPEEVAHFFGYPSAVELLEALTSAEKPREHIERLTDERMRDVHPELLTDAELPVEAMKAVHNEKRAQLLHKELEHLASGNLPALKGLIRKVVRRVPPLEAVRQQAEETIARKLVRAINPLLYQRAEARAAKLALDAFLKGDIETAFEEKQRELLSHELYRAATAAREQVDAMIDYLRTFDKPSKRAQLGKAGEEYLAQVDAIRERYSFKRVSLKALDRQQSLLNFVREQEANGVEITVPDAVLNEARRQSYQNTSYEEMLGVRDAVKQIEHLAKLKNRLLANARTRDLAEARDEIVASIAAHHNLTLEPVDLTRGFAARLTAGLKRGLAEHTRMEFLFEALDGSKPQGPVWQHLFKPMADAETAENELRRKDAEALKKILSVYSRKERADWFTKRVAMPEIRTERVAGRLTKANILAVALNWGNAYNRDALMQGYGWNEAQVQRILERLDARDWATVQAIWDHLETYWPAIAAQERKLTGLVPEKVEATPIDTRFGQFKGGYYPIAFDRSLSTRQTALDERANVREMFGGNWARAMTRHGHTIERTNTGGKPILLELTALTQHLGAVAHDLAYRPAIIDASRLIQQEEVRDAIERAAGREMYQQLNPWLHAIAGDRPREFANHTERLLGQARQGATVVGLGLKVTSALVQTLGYTLSVKELGAKYAYRGLRDAYANPLRIGRQWDFIAQRSGVMRDRLTSYDRDVRDYARRPGIANKDAAWFVFVGYLDLGTSIPTWLGAYRKAMDGQLEHVAKGDEPAAIDYADSAVRTTQAAGAAKDLASIQRGGEAWRLFTMFYSSMSILFNQFEKSRQQFLQDKSVPKLIAGLSMVWFVPAVLEDLLRGRGPSDDDDDGWFSWLVRKELLYPFSTVVLLRDIANSLDRYLTTKRIDFSGSPAFSAMESLVRTAAVGVKAAQGEDIERADVKAIAETAGYVGKLPSRQLWQSGEYLYDWLTGNEQPDNPMEFLWRAIVTGKKRD